MRYACNPSAQKDEVQSRLYSDTLSQTTDATTNPHVLKSQLTLTDDLHFDSFASFFSSFSLIFVPITHKPLSLSKDKIVVTQNSVKHMSTAQAQPDTGQWQSLLSSQGVTICPENLS